MAKNSRYRSHSKTYSTPSKSFHKPRLEAELKLCGEFGLRCKREIYRARLTLAKIRKTARELLTLDENDTKRIFEGDALLRRLHILGILEESKNQLDYVLGLKVEDLLKRRLQSVVRQNNIARSIHHSRVLIRQRHIQVNGQIVNVPGFMVRVSSEKHINFAETSTLHPTSIKEGRVKRMAKKRASAE